VPPKSQTQFARLENRSAGLGIIAGTRLDGSPRAARAAHLVNVLDSPYHHRPPEFCFLRHLLYHRSHQPSQSRRAAEKGPEYPDGSMTSAEINLPKTSELGADDSPHAMRDTGITTFPEPDSRRTSDPATDTEFEKDRFDEKEQGRYPRSDFPTHNGSEEEIVWRYLTFETEVPPPSSLYPSVHPTQLPSDDPHPTSRDHGSAPEPPDLAKYTNPFDWPETRKNYTIWVACIITALTAYSAGSYSPGIGQMTEEWGVSNVAALVGITTFTTGEFNRCLRGVL
jgi:hypothetical protein